MKPTIKSLQIIHLALCAGVIIVYLVLNNIKSISAIFSIPDISIEDYIFIAIPIIAVILSNFLYKTLLKKIEKNDNEDTKFMQFQNASIVRWALLEGVAFVILFIKPEFILFGILILMYLILLRPTEERFKNDTNFL